MGLVKKVKEIKKRFKEDGVFRCKVIGTATASVCGITGVTLGLQYGKRHNKGFKEGFIAGQIFEAEHTLSCATLEKSIKFCDSDDLNSITEIVVSDVKRYRND